MSFKHSVLKESPIILRSSMKSRYSLEYLASVYELLVPLFQQEIRNNFVDHVKSDREENARQRLLAQGA